MTYAVQPPPVTTLPVSGTEENFPVSRVYCVGRNYAEHAREMGHDPNREPPFFFMKPADAVVPTGRLPFPTQTQELHHEIELVVALGEGGTTSRWTASATTPDSGRAPSWTLPPRQNTGVSL